MSPSAALIAMWAIKVNVLSMRGSSVLLHREVLVQKQCITHLRASLLLVAGGSASGTFSTAGEHACLLLESSPYSFWG